MKSTSEVKFSDILSDITEIATEINGRPVDAPPHTYVCGNDLAMLYFTDFTLNWSVYKLGCLSYNSFLLKLTFEDRLVSTWVSVYGVMIFYVHLHVLNRP